MINKSHFTVLEANTFRPKQSFILEGVRSMKSLRRIIMAVLVLSVLLSVPLWSGTTGKIAGTITDKANGEPLIGVNVVVLGTLLGAATDVEGEFSILSVPPGTYSVQISSIGYKKITLSNVHVFIDQTTRLTVILEVEAIEVSETLVLGERPIKMDVATSVVDISSNDISKLSVANVDDIVNMQAGIKDGQIRGSGMDQALFLVDGITMRDPRNNQALTKVALSSVKEISVERGGFNAEYGQVQSGVIKVVTNEGKIKGYTVNLILQITPAAPKYYRGSGIPDIDNPNSYWLRPYFDPTVCWTGTNNGAWDSYTKSQYGVFDGGWNAVSQALCSDANPNNDLTPLGAQRAFEYEIRKPVFTNKPDYNIDGGLGGPVPFISEQLGNLRFFASYRGERQELIYPMSRPDINNYDTRLVLTSDVSRNIKLQVTGSLGNVATVSENWSYANRLSNATDFAGGTGGDPLVNLFGDFAYSLTDIDHRSLSAKMTHVLSDKTYYEVSAEYFRTHYFTRPPAARDTSLLFEVLPGFFESSNPLGYFPATSDGVELRDGSQDALARDNSTSSATTLKADITSQVDFNNMIKVGAVFTYNDINLDYGFIQMQTSGNAYANHVQIHNFPIQGGAYVQDKMETDGFTVNGGLRLDFSSARTDWWNYDPFDPNFYSYKYTGTTGGIAMRTSKAQWQLSPRLGISHPITENSKLYFNYGQFKQMPQYEGLFRVDRRPDHSLTEIGDPNLILAKTISYELGYDHQLFDNELLLQLTAFYRDISDQQNTTTYFPVSGASYTVTNANGYQDTRGVEITLRKTPGNWFSGFVNYTYQATSSGQFGIIDVYEDPAKQVSEYNEKTDKYYQKRTIPAPFARADLIFTSPIDFGPKVIGNHIFGDLMVNLLLNWSQGGWMTYNQNNTPGVNNNVQYVDYFDGRLRVSKGVSVSHFRIQIFADVSNLFNALRLRTGYGDLTTSGAYINSLHLPKSNAYNNIPGDDKIGAYRDRGVEWQPMIRQDGVENGNIKIGDRAIYYDNNTNTYWQTVGNAWVKVDQAIIDKINSTKAYINMPNPSTFWFLNPRNITFGFSASLDID
jgi:outer membrane receptor protein involved in Fe transport